jgi:hypothetical protein
MLTAVHDAASVDPDALVKYFPAGHAVHDEALEPEYVPEAHCTIICVCMRQRAAHSVCMRQCTGMNIVTESRWPAYVPPMH